MKPIPLSTASTNTNSEDSVTEITRTGSFPFHSINCEDAKAAEGCSECGEQAHISVPMSNATPPSRSRDTQPRRIPLNDRQKEIWLVCQIGDAACCTFNESRTLHLRGKLDVSRLCQSFQHLLDQNEQLRATFDASGLWQIIGPPVPLDISLLDFTSCSQPQRKAAVQALLVQQCQQVFDLTKSPLLRVTIVRLANDYHLCILTTHQIVCNDLFFLAILRELSSLYSAKPGQTIYKESSYIESSIRFHHYEEIHNAEYSTDSGRIPRLESLLPTLDLPTDVPRPLKKSYRGGRAVLRLNPVLLTTLRQYSADNKTTLFCTMLTAFSVLLHRLSGQEDFTFWLAHSSPAFAPAQMPTRDDFNIWPVQLTFNPAQTFASHLILTSHCVNDSCHPNTEDYKALRSPLFLTCDANQPPQSVAVFSMTSPLSGTDFEGLSIELTNNPRSYYHFDLGFNIVDTGVDWQIECDYNTDIFSHDTIMRWLSHYETLLQSVLQEEMLPVSRLSLLTAVQRHKLLVEWNQTETAYPRHLCLHTLFEHQVVQTPDAIAAVWGEQSLTYQALNERSEQIANCLYKFGIGSEARIGVLLERSLEILATIIGILKAGGAYVPLDPCYPMQRLAYILEDTQAELVITQECLLPTLADYVGPILCLDYDDLQHCEQAVQRRPNSSQPDHLSYIIYTSGSTGRPKGVAIEHRSAVALVHWAQGMFSRAELSGVLFSTSLCFDLSVFELFVPLSCGGTVIVAQNAMHLPLLTSNYPVTLVNTVPSVMAQLLRMGALPNSVTTVNLAGEPLSVSLVNSLYEHTSIKRVLDLYGPSEDTTYSTWALRRPNAMPSIGRPISNSKVYLLDSYHQPVPIGVAGEIYLGGAGLARGYWNSPELTAQRFITNPFEAGTRLYRTGDMAKWLPNGELQYLGRYDSQVKIRGHRIELEEIQSILEEHPEIAQAVVLLQKHRSADSCLTAYLVTQNGLPLATSELMSFMQKMLPDYMIPSDFVFLEKIPLTTNGKLDRNALSLPYEERRSANSYIAPRNAVERSLVSLLEEVLNVRPIGVHDSFFDLGGNSLRAIHFFHRIQQVFDTKLSVATLLSAPTVEMLAHHIRYLNIPSTLIVPIKEVHHEMRSKPALYCIHPLHGSVLCYHALARYLSPDQAVFGIQAWGLLQTEAPDRSIETMAARYVAALQDVDPAGPYCLAGHSFGGVVAYEMARQLRECGKQVAMVALLDTYPPVEAARPFLRRMLNHLQVIRNFSSHDRKLYIRFRLALRWKAIQQFCSRAGRHSMSESEVPLPPEIENIKNINLACMRDYRPGPALGNVTVFRACETNLALEAQHDPLLTWGDISPENLTVRVIPGDHLSMMDEPFVKNLAHSMQCCLDEGLSARSIVVSDS